MRKVLSESSNFLLFEVLFELRFEHIPKFIVCDHIIKTRVLSLFINILEFFIY